MQLLPMVIDSALPADFQSPEVGGKDGILRLSSKTVKAMVYSMIAIFIVAFMLIHSHSFPHNSFLREKVTTSSLPHSIIQTPIDMSTTDSICAPQVNDILMKETEDRNVDACYNIMSSFPQLGGEGCQCPCADSEKGNLSLQTSFSFLDIPDKFLEDIKIIVRILQAHGRLETDLRGSYYDPNTNTHLHKLHVPLLYHCCLSQDEATKIGEASRNLTWGALEASFEQLSCGRASESETYIYLTLDAESSARLASAVEGLHSHLQSKGVAEESMLKESRGFRMRIATVPADYPCNHALMTLKDQMPEDIFSRHRIRMKYLAAWDDKAAYFRI